MKRITPYVLLIAFVALTITACNKDNVGNDDVLTITPELLTSYIGKDYATISGSLEHKKDYWYTTLNNGNTLAAVSIPAKDPQAPALNYKLTLNVDVRNIVSTMNVECTDSLDIKTGNSLVLYYYDHAFSPMAGVYRKTAYYNYSQQPTAVEDILGRLRNYTCQQPVLGYTNSKMNITVLYSEIYKRFTCNLSAF